MINVKRILHHVLISSDFLVNVVDSVFRNFWLLRHLVKDMSGLFGSTTSLLLLLDVLINSDVFVLSN